LNTKDAISEEVVYEPHSVLPRFKKHIILTYEGGIEEVITYPEWLTPDKIEDKENIVWQT